MGVVAKRAPIDFAHTNASGDIVKCCVWRGTHPEGLSGGHLFILSNSLPALILEIDVFTYPISHKRNR